MPVHIRACALPVTILYHLASSQEFSLEEFIVFLDVLEYIEIYMHGCSNEYDHNIMTMVRF